MHDLQIRTANISLAVFNFPIFSQPSPYSRLDSANSRCTLRIIVDHSRSFRLEDGKSEYAEHVLLENHIFDDNFEILHVSHKGLKLNALESFEINKRKFDNILPNG